MKIVCDRKQLLSAFQKAVKVAPTRTPKSILQNVKLEARENGIFLTATDLEIGICVCVKGAKVESVGGALLSAKQFSSFLRKSPDRKLQIEADSQNIRVCGTRGEFNWPLENPEEFPVILPFEERQYHKVSAWLFRELIRRTIFAVDTENKTKFALGGVLLEMEPDKIIAVASDGCRVAKMEGAIESKGDYETGEKMMVVPACAMLLIEQLANKNTSRVLLAIRENDIVVKTANATIYARQIEGRFPKWRQVFPNRQNAVRINVRVGALLSMWEQATAMIDDECCGIECTFGKGKLVLVDSVEGHSRVEMPIGYDGEPITIRIDHRFVADFLKLFNTGKVCSIEIQDEKTAMIFSTNDGYDYVVMPLARE